MIATTMRQNTAFIALSGRFDSKILPSDLAELERLFSSEAEIFELNLNEVARFDIAFLVFLSHHKNALSRRQKSLRFTATSPQGTRMLELLADISAQDSLPQIPQNALSRFTATAKNAAKNALNITIDFVNFTGMLLWGLFKSLLSPQTMRLKATSYHIFSGVITALPIVAVISFVVGGVMAYQGAVILERMGFFQAAVEMTSKLTLREIGPFVVAAIIAGRNASSYTAQIGVMKITDEINAMRVMDFSLLNFIVLPRFVALVFSFPLMVFFSDVVAILGSMVFLKGGFGVGYADYLAQLREFVGMNSFLVGIIKAPFYAMTIVIVGCFVGFRVEDSTQSVGEKTTQSVVAALFGVIMVNAIFSLIFTKIRF